MLFKITTEMEILRYKSYKIGTGFLSRKLKNSDEKKQRKSK